MTGSVETKAVAKAIQGFSHVQIVVDDLAANVEFYERIFGFELLPRPDFGVAGAWLQGPNLQLHLIETPDRPPTVPGMPHFALSVSGDDFDSVVKDLRSLGIPFPMEPFIREDFGKTICTAFVTDPAGNVIEVSNVQPLASMQ